MTFPHSPPERIVSKVAEAGLAPDGVEFDVTSVADNRLRCDVVETENQRAAKSGAVSGDADLVRLIELWPMLSDDDRAALLAQAEHLATCRDDATGATSSR